MTTQDVGDAATAGRVSCPPSRAALMVVSLCVAGLVIVCQFYLVVPLFSAFTETWGVEDRAVLSQTMYGIAYAIGFLVWGRLVRPTQYRTVLTLAVTASGGLCLLCAAAPSWSLLVMTRAVGGFMSGALAPVAFALIASYVSARWASLATTALTTSFFAASIIGQWAGSFAGTTHWRMAFVVCGAFGLIAAAGVRVFVPTTAGARNLDGVEPPGYRYWDVLVQRRVLLLLLLAATTMVPYTALIVELSRSQPPATIRAYQVVILVVIIVTPLVADVLGRRASANARTSMALATAAIGLLLMTIVPTATAWHVVAWALVVLGAGLLAPSIVERLIGSTSGPRGATVPSLYTSALFVGASLGPLLAVSPWGSSSRLPWAALSVIALAALVHLLANRANAHPPHQTADDRFNRAERNR